MKMGSIGTVVSEGANALSNAGNAASAVGTAASAVGNATSSVGNALGGSGNATASGNAQAQQDLQIAEQLNTQLEQIQLASAEEKNRHEQVSAAIQAIQ